tara:strand:+ start:1208 stop:1588 length:381 start_codon:yes stop_codon:yes gene_type:complete
MSQVVNEHGLTVEEKAQHEIDYEAWCKQTEITKSLIRSGGLEMRKDYSTKQKEIVMDYQQKVNSDYKNNKPNIENMRRALAERQGARLGSSDLLEILLDGCNGWRSMPEDEVREMYDYYFGEDNER